MNLISRPFLAAAALLCAASVGRASAATVTTTLGTLSPATVITGTLASEAEVQLEDFTLSSATSLTVFTTSYGGGMNLNGTSTPAGGFQPLVALYNPSGFTIAQTTGSYPGNPGDPKTGIVGDSYFTTANLMAGSYILAIANWATTGDPVSGFSDAGTGSFKDVGGNTRTGNYAVDITSSAIASTPEPAAFWLILPAASALFAFSWKRRSGKRVS